MSPSSHGAIVLSLEITLLRTQTWAGKLESGHELGASEPLSSTLRDFIYQWKKISLEVEGEAVPLLITNAAVSWLLRLVSNTRVGFTLFQAKQGENVSANLQD